MWIELDSRITNDMIHCSAVWSVTVSLGTRSSAWSKVSWLLLELRTKTKRTINTGITVKPVLATTWQKRPPENCGHVFSVPSIRGFKCTECILENATTWEMRIADTGSRPKAVIKPAKSDHICQNEWKTLFWLSNFSFAGTPNERSSRLQALLGMVVANYTPAYTWELPIADFDGSCMCMGILVWTTPFWKFLNQTWQMRPPEK